MKSGTPATQYRDELGHIRIGNGDEFAWYPPHFANARYTVKGLLASGGQGYVLLARDTLSDCLVTIKGMWWTRHALNPNHAESRYQERLAIVEQSARVVAALAARSLGVPKLVEVLVESSPTRMCESAQVTGNDAEARRLNEEFFIVQQYIQEIERPKTLRDLVEQGGPLRGDELVTLGEDLTGIMAAMHEQTGPTDSYWAHCDIKPDNVLCGAHPRQFYLIDFDATIEVNPHALVTPEFTTDGFRPPDLGELATALFDIHCFGATLFYATTSESPHEYLNTAASGRRAMRKVLHQHGLNPLMARIIIDCLRERPFFRPASAHEILRELRTLRANDAARAVLDEGLL